MNPIWIGRFDVCGPKESAYLEGNAGAWVWMAAQAEDAAKLLARATFAMNDLGLTVIDGEDLQEVTDEDELSEELWSLLPEARRNVESVVCGTWHLYKNHDA